MDTETVLEGQIATVWTTSDGAPERFVWNRRWFVVCARPIPWIARGRWWRQNAAPASERAGRTVEQAMWQVQARAVDDGEMLIFDLAVAKGHRWSIRVVSD